MLRKTSYLREAGSLPTANKCTVSLFSRGNKLNGTYCKEDADLIQFLSLLSCVCYLFIQQNGTIASYVSGTILGARNTAITNIYDVSALRGFTF